MKFFLIINIFLPNYQKTILTILLFVCLPCKLVPDHSGALEFILKFQNCPKFALSHQTPYIRVKVYRQITYYPHSLLIPSHIFKCFRIPYFTYLTKYLSFVKTVFSWYNFWHLLLLNYFLLVFEKCKKVKVYFTKYSKF